jgi:hypothetical protein
MSVLLECQPGDTFFCLQDFRASPDGEGFSWDTCRHFRVGEKLGYVSFREDSNKSNRSTGWLLIFDAADGKRYATVQTYFVTEECWNGLREHFAGRRRKAQPAKKAKTTSARPVSKKKQPVGSSLKKRRST